MSTDIKGWVEIHVRNHWAGVVKVNALVETQLSHVSTSYSGFVVSFTKMLSQANEVFRKIAPMRFWKH